jgi:hypothetical protein
LHRPGKAIAASYATWTSKRIAGRSTAAVTANAALSETPICKPCAGRIPAAAKANAVSYATGICRLSAGRAPADERGQYVNQSGVHMELQILFVIFLSFPFFNDDYGVLTLLYLNNHFNETVKSACNRQGGVYNAYLA